MHVLDADAMQVPALTSAPSAVDDDADDDEPAAAAEAGAAAAQAAAPSGALTIDISTQLHQYWKAAETSYLGIVTQILAHLRCSREAATLWFRDHRHDFVAFIERDSAEKHKLVKALTCYQCLIEIHGPDLLPFSGFEDHESEQDACEP